MSIVTDQHCLPTYSSDDDGETPPVAPPERARGRKLLLKARAERMGETRRRIARATYELHASVGPARTTVSAIAERAGVQRLTVYKHFPHDRDIFQACTTYHWELDPAPDPDQWRLIADPEQRLRHGLTELYAYFRRNEALYANVQRDASRIMELLDGAPPPGLQRLIELPAKWHAALAGGWSDTDRAPLRNAAIGLAVEFGTWRALVTGQHLEDAQAIELMVNLVRSAAGPSRVELET
jgi:AcrR family transcriptional regulator